MGLAAAPPPDRAAAGAAFAARVGRVMGALGRARQALLQVIGEGKVRPLPVNARRAVE